MAENREAGDEVAPGIQNQVNRVVGQVEKARAGAFVSGRPGRLPMQPTLGGEPLIGGGGRERVYHKEESQAFPGILEGERRERQQMGRGLGATGAVEFTPEAEAEEAAMRRYYGREVGGYELGEILRKENHPDAIRFATEILLARWTQEAIYKPDQFNPFNAERYGEILHNRMEALAALANKLSPEDAKKLGLREFRVKWASPEVAAKLEKQRGELEQRKTATLEFFDTVIKENKDRVEAAKNAEEKRTTEQDLKWAVEEKAKIEADIAAGKLPLGVEEAGILRLGLEITPARVAELADEIEYDYKVFNARTRFLEFWRVQKAFKNDPRRYLDEFFKTYRPEIPNEDYILMANLEAVFPGRRRLEGREALAERVALSTLLNDALNKWIDLAEGEGILFKEDANGKLIKDKNGNYIPDPKRPDSIPNPFGDRIKLSETKKARDEFIVKTIFEAYKQKGKLKDKDKWMVESMADFAYLWLRHWDVDTTYSLVGGRLTEFMKKALQAIGKVEGDRPDDFFDKDYLKVARRRGEDLSEDEDPYENIVRVESNGGQGDKRKAEATAGRQLHQLAGKRGSPYFGIGAPGSAGCLMNNHADFLRFYGMTQKIGKSKETITLWQLLRDRHVPFGDVVKALEGGKWTSSAFPQVTLQREPIEVESGISEDSDTALYRLSAMNVYSTWSAATELNERRGFYEASEEIRNSEFLTKLNKPLDEGVGIWLQSIGFKGKTVIDGEQVDLHDLRRKLIQTWKVNLLIGFAVARTRTVDRRVLFADAARRRNPIEVYVKTPKVKNDRKILISTEAEIGNYVDDICDTAEEAGFLSIIGDVKAANGKNLLDTERELVKEGVSKRRVGYKPSALVGRVYTPAEFKLIKGKALFEPFNP